MVLGINSNLPWLCEGKEGKKIEFRQAPTVILGSMFRKWTSKLRYKVVILGSSCVNVLYN